MSTPSRLPHAVVLHVVTRYLNGGSERRLRDAVASTPEFEHQIVVGRDHDPEGLSRDFPRSKIHVVPSLVRRPDPGQDLKTYRTLTKAVRRHPPDLVHTHQSKAGALGRAVAWRNGIASVHSLSGANFGPSFGRGLSLLIKAVERFLANRTQLFAVVGEDLRDRFLALGVEPARLRVIRSSIDLDRFRTQQSSVESALRLGVDSSHGVLAYVGRFESGKGVAELASLVRHVHDLRGRMPWLILAGDGPLKQDVVSRCREVMNARVLDLGHTDRVPDVLAASNVVVLLSRAEGVPQILVQTLAARRPFVAYAADGVRELAARAPSCVAVPIGDLRTAASAIATILDQTNIEIAVDLSEWSTDSVTASYRAAYHELLPAMRRSTAT